MKIEIQGLEEVKKTLGRYANQIPFAVHKALNATAAGARQATVDEIKTVFDRPTPYILKSAVYARSPDKRTLTAAVALVDPAEFVYDIGADGKMKIRPDQTGGPTTPALVPHIEGGGRQYKEFEKALYRKGVLPAGMHVVPGKGAWLDQYGNVPQGEIVKILSEVQAFTAAGSSMNSRGKSKGYYRNFRYFVMRRGGRPIGIFAREKRSNSVQPVLMFVRRAAYKKRLDFYRTVHRYIQQNWQKHFDAALDHAIRTAR